MLTGRGVKSGSLAFVHLVTNVTSQFACSIFGNTADDRLGCGCKRVNYRSVLSSTIIFRNFMKIFKIITKFKEKNKSNLLESVREAR